MVRIAVIGVGRIGSMHAELLARRVAGADGRGVADAHAGGRARPSARRWACRRVEVEDALAAATPTRSRSARAPTRTPT